MCVVVGDLCDQKPMTHLPPPDAWHAPQKWLRFERGEAVGGNPDATKLTLPTDDNGLVMGAEAVKMVRGLFKPDFLWRYDRNDPKTKPDVHHWYGTEAMYEPEMLGGRTGPKTFRNLAPNLASGQRMFHNAIHETTALALMPCDETMDAFTDRYLEARRLLNWTRVAAEGVVARRGQFRGHFIAGERPANAPPYPDGSTRGDTIVKQQFDRNFKGFRRALDAMLHTLQERPDVADELGVTFQRRHPTPEHVVRVLSKCALPVTSVSHVAWLLQAA